MSNGKEIRTKITPLIFLPNDKQISKEITCLNCLQNDKEIREIKTSLNCLSNHKEIRGLSPSPRTSMSFTPSLYIFSHGEAFEARANIEKTKKSQGMTPEQVKEKLEGVKWINKEIKGLYLELEVLESGIIKKPTLSHSRVQTSRENKTENNLISVLKLKEDTLQRIERLTEERMAISELIDKLANPLERSVLRLFYLNDLVASEVAEEIDRSNTTVYIIRQKAIEHLTGIVNGD